MTKKTISQDDYLRLLGLLTLAADHRRALEAIERSACGITGTDPDAGSLTSDTVWGGHLMSGDDLLRLLDITVEQPGTTPEQASEQARKAMAIARHWADLGSES